MKSNILFYVVVGVLCTLVVYAQFKTKKKVDQNQQQSEKSYLLETSLEIEKHLVGANLPDYFLLGEEQRETSLAELISRQNGLQVIILTSMETCSACRDSEIEVWNNIASKAEGLPIYLIVSENRQLNPIDVEKLHALAKASGTTFSHFTDADSVIFADLGLDPKNTPISLILDERMNVIAANCGTSLTQDKSAMFSEMAFKLMNRNVPSSP